MFQPGDFEDCKFSSKTYPVARKKHYCIECCREIKPGEKYMRVVQKTDYGLGTYKTCLHCQVAVEWLIENCNGYMSEGVFEDMKEHSEAFLFENRKSDSFRMARMVACMRREWKSFKDPNVLMPVLRLDGVKGQQAPV